MNAVARDFDREAEQVGTRRYNYDFDAIVRRAMMRSFAPLLPPGRALELGCYLGESTEMLAESYADLTVVEASPKLVEAARQRLGGRARFICSTFEALTLEERFDCIFLINTLEHVVDPVAVLAKVRDWLTPGGRLFVLVPNAQAPSRQIAVKMGLITHIAAVTPAEAANGHHHSFCFDTLERAVRAAGLGVVTRGGLIFKALANYQFDAALRAGIISEAYIEGCYALGMQHPELTASIYLVCDDGRGVGKVGGGGRAG